MRIQTCGLNLFTIRENILLNEYDEILLVLGCFGEHGCNILRWADFVQIINQNY